MKKEPNSIEEGMALTKGHAVTLAIWQLAQPANRKAIYSLLAKTKIGPDVTWAEFESVCDRLEKDKLLWEARKDHFIVTPKGASLANSAIPLIDRDRRRLFYLNRQRRFEVDA